MIPWKPFVHAGITYSLEHLHPCTMTFVQPASAGKPARDYRVRVFFTLHCFTRSAKGEETIDAQMAYGDKRETRIFDFDRYFWSLRLPEIVRALPRFRCFHTNHGNFFTVRRGDSQGHAADYEIYFNALRSNQAGIDLDLDIQSAYVRDAAHATGRKRKPVDFLLILYNRLTNRPLTAPR